MGKRAAVEEARQAVETFLAQAQQPAVVEPGEEPIPLEEGSFLVEHDAGRLLLQAWTAERNLVRSIIGVGQTRRSSLQLRVEKFGKREGTLELLDLSSPQAQATSMRNVRLSYREQFRRSLHRQFPSWTLSEVSTEADLQHSLSPAYARALLTKGNTHWAAIGTADPDSADGALTFGLIWLEYVRARQRLGPVEGLALFLPEGTERTTCLRLQHLNARTAQWAVFVQYENGEEQIDYRDHGNLDTNLQRRMREPGIESDWVARIALLPDVETIEVQDEWSFRVRGFEFARYRAGVLRAGIDRKQKIDQSQFGEVMMLAGELARLRSCSAADERNPLYTRAAEGWLESQVRAQLTAVDPTLLLSPVYGQVPALAGGERGVIDLLACEQGGRLCVIELKASEDIHLPLQALDYWMRVNWHVERGEFSTHGYFPGAELSSSPPRLVLIAPALNFHPTTAAILRYFPQTLDVERIGVGMDWRRELKVMFRLHGSERPDSRR